MTLERLVSEIARFGVEDRVLAGFMLLGPPIIVLTLIGRLAITTVIVATYVCLFVLYILYKGI